MRFCGVLQGERGNGGNLSVADSVGMVCPHLFPAQPPSRHLGTSQPPTPSCCRGRHRQVVALGFCKQFATGTRRPHRWRGWTQTDHQMQMDYQQQVIMRGLERHQSSLRDLPS